MRKTNRETMGVGIAAAFIASLCCIGPLILISLGLGTASTSLSIGSKKPYFLALGLIFFVISLYLFIKYRRTNICHGCTTKDQEKKRIINTILIACLTLGVLYILLIYVVTPWLAPFIYELLYSMER